MRVDQISDFFFDGGGGYLSDGVGLQCLLVANGPETARLVFSVGGFALAFPRGFCCAQALRTWKSEGNAFVFEVSVGVMLCENLCSDCHESCRSCSAMYDMHAASVAVHNIDYDKRGDRYKNMTFLHGFEHNAC